MLVNTFRVCYMDYMLTIPSNLSSIADTKIECQVCHRVFDKAINSNSIAYDRYGGVNICETDGHFFKYAVETNCRLHGLVRFFYYLLVRKINCKRECKISMIDLYPHFRYVHSYLCKIRLFKSLTLECILKRFRYILHFFSEIQMQQKPELLR